MVNETKYSTVGATMSAFSIQYQTKFGMLIFKLQVSIVLTAHQRIFFCSRDYERNLQVDKIQIATDCGKFNPI